MPAGVIAELLCRRVTRNNAAQMVLMA